MSDQTIQMGFWVAFLAATLRIATPLILTSLGGVINEKSGVTNIGLEGIMVMGAFFAVVGSEYTHNPWIGLLTGIVAGIVTAGIHAFLSITLKADQIISGTAINTLATALPSMLLFILFGMQSQSEGVHRIEYSEGVRSALGSIPLIGTFLLQLNYMVYFAIFMAIFLTFMFNRSRWGLRLKAVGEHPKAADTLGINVIKTRYKAVIFSGILAAMGGASLSIVSGNIYRDGMINGRGFIALAAMIFGNWTPLGALGASLLFGAAEALQIRSQSIGLPLPTEFYYILPYLLTMVAITAFGKKSHMPAALGKPYEKGQR
ncbi:ABC transporter, permease protein [Clostridiaceae bacterium JG1575]|nr:ABC transporter, permease protein [Clostridiaceae bacterium JG1575]